MDININIPNLNSYRPSTKTLLAVGVVLEAAWQTQSIHDLIISFIHAHPHWSGLVALAGGLVALLHNPQVQAVLDGNTSKS